MVSASSAENPALFDRGTDFRDALRGKAGVVGRPRLMRIFVDQVQVQLDRAGTALRRRRSVQEARQVADAIQPQAGRLRRACGFLSGRSGVFLGGLGLSRSHWEISIFVNT